jgi:hypothetical protein
MITNFQHNKFLKMKFDNQNYKEGIELKQSFGVESDIELLNY